MASTSSRCVWPLLLLVLVALLLLWAPINRVRDLFVFAACSVLNGPFAEAPWLLAEPAMRILAVAEKSSLFFLLFRFFPTPPSPSPGGPTPTPSISGRAEGRPPQAHLSPLSPAPLETLRTLDALLQQL
jgi:hypothetical protein